MSSALIRLGRLMEIQGLASSRAAGYEICLMATQLAHSDRRGARDPLDFSVPVAYHSIVVVVVS